MSIVESTAKTFSDFGISLGSDKVKELSLTDPKKATPEQIDKAAEDFEALLLQQMFAAMWSSVPEGEMLGGGNEVGLYRDLLNQELSKEVAHSQSIGLKKVFADDMSRLEGTEVPQSRRLAVG